MGKLVVDIDSIMNKLTSYSSEAEEFKAKTSTFKNKNANFNVDGINNIINSYIDEIYSDLQKVSNKAVEYYQKVDNSCSFYQENESDLNGGNQICDVQGILDIVTSAPKLIQYANNHVESAAADLVGFKGNVNLSYGVGEYKESDELGLYGIFTGPDGKKYMIYDQTEIFNNQSSWGVSWGRNDKCVRCALASILSGYNSDWGKAALNKNALWSGSSYEGNDGYMPGTIESVSGGKLSASYETYSTEGMKTVLKSGGKVVLYVTNSSGKSGKQWACSQHAISILGYDQKEDKVFVSTSGLNNNGQNGWVRADEFENINSSYNNMIVVKEK